MKLWIDDVRPAPEGYVWLKSTNSALRFIRTNKLEIKHISLDHDAGDYYTEGGDFIGVLNELERLSHHQTPQGVLWKVWLQDITFSLHSANPVGVANMRAIIERNGWKEI